MADAPPLFQPRPSELNEDAVTACVIAQPRTSAFSPAVGLAAGAARLGQVPEQVKTSAPLVIVEADNEKVVPALQSCPPPVHPPWATVAPDVVFQQKLLEPSLQVPTRTVQDAPAHALVASPVLCSEVIVELVALLTVTTCP